MARLVAAFGTSHSPALNSPAEDFVEHAKRDSGNSEIRNWIVTAGAAEVLTTTWQEYVPLYRTPAGTGCAMGFAAWEA
jgi:hypothetical protein